MFPFDHLTPKWEHQKVAVYVSRLHHQGVSQLLHTGQPAIFDVPKYDYIYELKRSVARGYLWPVFHHLCFDILNCYQISKTRDGL